MRDTARQGRTGFTTGACAAAAARAATLGLVSGTIPSQIRTRLPNGSEAEFTIISMALHQGQATATVIKDAGDDPDVTDKAAISATVTALAIPDWVEIEGGEGVGRVTLPGLGLSVGSAAINPVPRRNIEENMRQEAADWLAQQGLKVVIAVANGALIAERTLNARLGIIGGISILGTSGIVYPWSTRAFRMSVEQGIQVAARRGIATVVLTTGGRSEKFAMAQLPTLPEGAFVQMGDFLAPALQQVVAEAIPQVVIAGMVGKLTKMAQGETITHAHRNPVNMALVAELAAEAGAPEATVTTIRSAVTARFASETLATLGLTAPFHRALAERVVQRLGSDYQRRFSLRVLLCDHQGNYLAEAKSAW
ncbi:MAG: cobalt-precorrin-5B (C(1))-methyltransferase [Gammaproteobacteria bacterium]|nr:cobalt-precorrin-5B (C(1))-methyltransferase [Gammaproteobacteria bacterium]